MSSLFLKHKRFLQVTLTKIQHCILSDCEKLTPTEHLEITSPEQFHYTSSEKIPKKENRCCE